MSKEVDEGQKTGDDSISARTSDGQAVYLDCSVIYRIDANEVVRLHIELQNRYISDFMRPVMRGIIRTEVSQFTADEINSSKRKNLEANLEDLLRSAFTEKGFVLDRFLLRNVSFSPQYASAIEAKQVAEQGRIQTEYQAEQMRRLAQGESDRSRILAEGRAAAIQIEAQAQATAIATIREALAQDQLAAQYWAIQKLNPNVQVMVLPSNSPFIFPMPNLGQTPVNASTLLPTMTLTTTLPLPGLPLSATPTPAPTAGP
jgi:regulator of protease activity HflC (stomatin/prohibitin superfamily)